jgi:hypothetical protein
MGSLPAGTSVGQCPQQVQGELDVARERDRIEGLTLLRKGLALGLGQDATEKHPLGGGPGGVVPLDDRAAEPVLTQELADGAEEVVVQPEQAVEALQDGQGGPGAVAIATDEAADEEPVALLDPGLIILAIRPAAGEADALATAPRHETRVAGARRRGSTGAAARRPAENTERSEPAERHHRAERPARRWTKVH